MRAAVRTQVRRWSVGGHPSVCEGRVVGFRRCHNGNVGTAQPLPLPRCTPNYDIYHTVLGINNVSVRRLTFYTQTGLYHRQPYEALPYAARTRYTIYLPIIENHVELI